MTEKPENPFDSDHQPDLFREADKALRGALDAEELWQLSHECDEQESLACDSGHRLTAELVERFGAWTEQEAVRLEGEE